MSNGIWRKVTLGIAEETGGYGVAANSATYALANVDMSFNETVVKVENTAAVGSTYQVNASVVAYKYTDFTLRAKVDENLLPLILKQKMSIVSAAVGGDTGAYTHTMTYSSTNAGASYTLLMDDSDRTDLKFAGAVFGEVNLMVEPKGFVLMELKGRSKFAITGTVTVAVTSMREFTGRNAAYTYAITGGVLASTRILSLEMKHNFNLAPENDVIGLGDSTLSAQYTTADRIEDDITLLYNDNTIKDQYEAGTSVQSKLVLQDTGRIISGSSTNLNPYIEFTRPVQSIASWSRDGGNDDLLKQKVTLLALDEVNNTNAPFKVVVKNNVASY